MLRRLEFHNAGANSHKFYSVTQAGLTVSLRWGRVGTVGQHKDHNFSSVAEASTFAQAKLEEKLNSGYLEVKPSLIANPFTRARLTSTRTVPPPAPTPAPVVKRDARLVPMLCTESSMDKLVQFVEDDRFSLEPKLDGHRVLLKVEKGQHPIRIAAIGRSGQESQHSIRFRSGPYLDWLVQLPDGTTVLDGELVGGTFYVFDLLQEEGKDYRGLPYSARRSALELRFDEWEPDDKRFALIYAAHNHTSKGELAIKAMQEKAEGLVIKLKMGTVKPGVRSDEMLKIKFIKEADLIVTGLGHKGKDNAVLSCFKDGKLVEVGRCSTIGKVPVNVGDVVVIRYLYLGAGERVVQPRLMSVRTDKYAQECDFGQLVGTNKTPITQ